MNISIKTRIVVKAICIIILLALCVMIYVRGKDLSCDKCQVKFISSMQNWQGDYENKITEVWVMDLYSELNKGHCYVKWDKDAGFYIS